MSVDQSGVGRRAEWKPNGGAQAKRHMHSQRQSQEVLQKWVQCARCNQWRKVSLILALLASVSTVCCTSFTQRLPRSDGRGTDVCMLNGLTLPSRGSSSGGTPSLYHLRSCFKISPKDWYRPIICRCRMHLWTRRFRTTGPAATICGTHLVVAAACRRSCLTTRSTRSCWHRSTSLPCLHDMFMSGHMGLSQLDIPAAASSILRVCRCVSHGPQVRRGTGAAGCGLQDTEQDARAQAAAAAAAAVAQVNSNKWVFYTKPAWQTSHKWPASQLLYLCFRNRVCRIGRAKMQWRKRAGTYCLRTM